MLSFLKIIALAIAAQFMVAAAFVSNGSQSTAYRSVQVQVQRQDVLVSGPLTASSPSTTQLHMAVATPEKTKEKKVVKDTDSESEKEKDRGWLVRLYNDPMNKREFVARCLNEICGLGDGAAFTIMMTAHQAGIAVVGNYAQEQAEHYRMQLLEEGLLVDMIPADDE